MLNIVRIGTTIADLRKQHGFTQNDLAEQLYVTHQAVSKWEQGKSVPGIEILYELTKLFNVSIDYLLEDTDIDDQNYDQLLQNYNRDVVVSRFLQSDSQKTDFPDIFYRLTQPERTRIINHVIASPTTLDPEDIWPYLSIPERNYLFGAIVAGSVDFDINRIYTQLTTAEQRTINAAYQRGDYAYKLRTFHYHIK